MNNSKHSILIADDDQDVLSALKLAFKEERFVVNLASSPAEAMRLLERKRFSCILMDLNYTQDTTSGKEGVELMRAIREVDSEVPVIVMTGFGSIDLAVDLMKLGASDFVEKPWRNTQLLQRVKQQIERVVALRRNHQLAQENALLKQQDQQQVIAKSNAMIALLGQIERIAQSDMNVLFTGENGTGKSMLANYLHQCSSRNEHSFLAVNMGAVTETLFESEMFGHVKGAFTDAKEERIGRFELAESGTLFLDEIANINLVQQAKLLRVLEERQFERVGSAVTLRADVRLVSATNANLSELVESGCFRQDLLYRLNTVEIRIPSLKERAEDIVPLAEHFLQSLCQKYNLPIKQFSTDTITTMMHYSWPGNIRELAHTIERSLFMSGTEMIEPSDLGLNPSASECQLPNQESTLEQIEKKVIIERLRLFNNDPAKTAESLGLSRSAYYRRLEKHQLNHGI